MSKTQTRAVLVVCILAASVFAWAQAGSKPGLYQMAVTMAWQKSPLPPGMNLPPGVQNPFGPSTHTSYVCVTQEMIDKYGTPMSTSSQGGESCTVSNVVRTPSSMSADETCTGRMNMQGTVHATWAGDSSTHVIAHFTGTMNMGPNPVPIEYSIDTTSTYKGADCGSVKPLPMPATK